MSAPVDREAEDAVACVLGWRLLSWTGVHGGYTPAARYVVRDLNRRAFVKLATTTETVAHLHREIAAYRATCGAFRPRLHGACDDTQRPILVIEDLSAAAWPPPWSEARLQAVLESVAALHGSSSTLRPYADVHGCRMPGWQAIARDPTTFLSLGLASEGWLAGSLPRLIEAEATCSTQGDAATHGDLRSDNICFVEGRAILIDWGEACLSNPKLDLGLWAPSLAHEGGPQPEAVLGDAPEVAAWVSGYFAERAGLPPLPDAPLVRRIQRQQLSASLPWVCRALGLGSPIGRRAYKEATAEERFSKPGSQAD